MRGYRIARRHHIGTGLALAASYGPLLFAVWSLTDSARVTAAVTIVAALATAVIFYLLEAVAEHNYRRGLYRSSRSDRARLGYWESTSQTRGEER